MSDASSLSTAVSLDEALRRIRSKCAVIDARRVSMKEAYRRILRENVCAREDAPPFDRSAVDGFAVRMNDPSPQFTVVDEIRAGDWKPRSLEIGQAVRIYTGAPLPCPELTVLMQEDVKVEGATMQPLLRSDERHIRFQGEDARRGALLVPASRRLNAGELAILASVGYAHPLVSRPPLILHYVTGDELVAPDGELAPGQIRDCNSEMIRALLASDGLDVFSGRLPENYERSLGCLQADMDSAADVLLISGGASVGTHDYTRRLLEALGFDIHFAQVRVRPGKPLIFATRGKQVVFGIPGNPLAHFVCYPLFIRTALNRMQGLDAGPVFYNGFLAEALAIDPGPRETFWPARLELTRRGFTLHPLRWQSSGDVTVLNGVQALMRIPSNTDSQIAGAEISFLPLNWPGDSPQTP